MKLLDLHINGFGKFHGKDMDFQNGLNVVYGKNEAGKSTIHTFIRGMLFGIERGRGRASRNDLYTKYEPWEDSANYQGWLRLESGGFTYRIERKFSKNSKEVHVINETLGKEITPDKTFYDQVLCGLTETSYNNTISIGQLKSATDSSMVAELKNYIANLNTSGSMALNITRASAFLKKQRKDLENQIVPEAARNYTTLLGEIRGIEQEISSPEFENQLTSCRSMQKDVNERLAKKREEREELIQKIARGRQILAGNQFDGEASIRAYLQKAEKVYGEYKTARADSEKKSRPVLSILCFLLAAVSLLASTGLFAGLLPVPFPPLWGGAALAAAAVLLLLAGLLLRMKIKRCQKELELSAGLIREIFARHLGDGSISDEAMNALSQRMEEFVRLNAALEKSEASLREQQAEIETLQQKSESCSAEIETQQRLQWELEKKLERLSFCKDQVAALQHVIDENDRLRDEITAIDLALETMTEVSTSIRASFGLLLNKTASDLISGITGGIYRSMSVDENLNIFMNTRTKLVPIEQVSSGTMDQIYLALRLAVARLMQGKNDPLPLIFDDSFVQYDDERLRTALRWLAASYDGQCIIFTCHRRELQILEEEKIPFHRINI